MERLSLVSVGDKADFDAFKRLHKERKRFSNSCISYHAVSYRDLLNGKTPKIKTKSILFFLFFPFDYWNKKVETRNYKGIYANPRFYKKFVNFFKRVNSSIKKDFPDKKIYFVNTPLLSARCRDKLAIKKALNKRGFSTPRLYKGTKLKDIYRYLAGGRSFFIKVRYGSMGKGITFISPSGLKTNFAFRNKKILSRKSDYGWQFRNVIDKKRFLKKLFRSSIYVEEAVNSLLIKEKKFDLRVYVFYDKALFVYPKSNDPENITTNISQGGEGEYPAFLASIPKSVINRIKKTALKATRALGVNFASVDVLLGHNLKDVYIIDINVFPGFPNRKIFNLAKHLVGQLKKIATFQYR